MLGTRRDSAANGTLRFGNDDANNTSGVDANVSLYPNPAKSEVRITGNTVMQKAEVIDMLGKTIAILTPQDNVVNISALKSGVYFMKLSGDGSTAVKRLIVQ